MSPGHCTEITKIVLKDAKIPAIPEPSAIPSTSQRAAICSGLEVQEPQNLYFVRAWDEAESEHGLAPNALAVDNETCELAYKIHVHLSVEPFTALSSPLTEIVLWNLKEGAKREKVEELLTALMSVVNAIPSSEGMYKAGWGPVLENDRQFVVMIGWENMEAFQTAVRNSPEGRALLDQLDEHTDRHLRHVVLQQAQMSFEARL